MSRAGLEPTTILITYFTDRPLTIRSIYSNTPQRSFELLPWNFQLHALTNWAIGVILYYYMEKQRIELWLLWCKHSILPIILFPLFIISALLNPLSTKLTFYFTLFFYSINYTYSPLYYIFSFRPKTIDWYFYYIFKLNLLFNVR